MKRGFSIRYKFLAVTTLLLVTCVGTYLVMASQVFRKDKTELVFDLNRSVVTNLASDLETAFNSATDKMRLAAYFFTARDERNLTILSELLAASQEIVFVGGSERFDQVGRRFFRSQQFAETYALPEDYFETVLSEAKPVPFTRIQTEGEAVWNATVENGPPLIGYGKSVVLEDAKGKPQAHYAVVAYLRADRIVKALGRSELNQAMVVNAAGEILAHSDPATMIRGQDPSVEPLLKVALTEEVRTSVMRYRAGDASYLGAYARAANNRILVISRVSAKAAFAVVEHFLLRSLLVALMVVNLAFIAAILFSKSLTQPIQVLIEGMRRVAGGELNTQIAVNTRDEIAELAGSFNGMIRDLKQSREALEEINRDLESKVQERTQQLEKQNHAVKSAQEALLRTTRLAAVGEIAGRAAHEVLNPLTSILARLERLRGRLGQERRQELQVLKDMVASWRQDFKKGGFNQLIKAWQAPSQVMASATLWEEDLTNMDQAGAQLHEDLKRFGEDADFLYSEAQRIGRIVQSMRSLSVVQSYRKSLRLKDVVEESANIMRDLASQHKISIEVTAVPNDTWVLVDHDELLQVLTNMFRNGIHAVVEMGRRNPNHKGQLAAEIRAEGESWTVWMRDNGMGISSENCAKLFENQFSTKPHDEGTGLGLNISRRFVRAMGGDIVLESSTLNVGTCFKITLPQHHPEASEEVA